MTPKVCLYILLGLFSLSIAQALVLPKELKRLMANVHNLESFMKAMKLGNITLGSSKSPVGGGVPGRPSFKVDNGHKKKHGHGGRRPSLRLRKVALGRSRVVSFSEDSRTPIILEDIKCKPYPTVIKVPQPDHNQGFLYPFNIMLHRCGGSCLVKPRIQQCVPNVTQYIDVLAFVVSWNSLSDKVDDLHRAPRLITFVNHTACGCQCITKPSECNPATQRFVEDNCRCECKVQSKRCPRYQVWNPVQCKCICNPPQYIYCPRRFEWNREKCSCVCKNTTCRANKVKNHRNCRCYCSKQLPPCGQGLVRSRRDCKCRPRYSDN